VIPLDYRLSPFKDHMPDENDGVPSDFDSLRQVERVSQLNPGQWLSPVTGFLHLRHLVEDGG
jgi:hypothetical protein